MCASIPSAQRHLRLTTTIMCYIYAKPTKQRLIRLKDWCALPKYSTSLDIVFLYFVSTPTFQHFGLVFLHCLHGTCTTQSKHSQVLWFYHITVLWHSMLYGLCYGSAAGNIISSLDNTFFFRHFLLITTFHCISS